MRILFTLAAFLSSALLFVVEPLAARLILPTFGGTPQVWNTSLVFFQAVLLLGYLYAHVGMRRLRAFQRPVHLGVAALALLALPMTTTSPWFASVRERAIGTSVPALLVLLALVGLVGLPFFALSANSSVLQAWYARSSASDRDRPWFLYAAGNLGSMLALLAYPLLIEPRLTLAEQARNWTGGYVLLLVLLAACAVFSRNGELAAEVAVEPTPAPDRSEKLQWIALAAVPSSLLLGVTTYLTSNIAPIPLLWVVPLALYLLTFVLVFARRPIAPAKVLGRIFPLLLTPLVLTIVLESDRPMVPLAILHLSVFFIACWMCHSRLSEARPAPEHLTEFYFYLSLGGVIGGIFNALIAPAVFDTLAEYPAGLVMAALLIPRKPGAKNNGRMDAIYPLAVAGVMILMVLVTKLAGIEASPMRTFLTIGLPVILCFVAVDSPMRFGLSLAAGFMVAAGLHVSSDGNVPLTSRSFFGIHRVLIQEHNRFRKLIHGNTIHGVQDIQNPRTPLTYYHPSGPIGQIMTKYHPPKVALVGLGVGSLAAYGEPGQRLTYYEIDPTVRRVASDTRFFTFLRDCRANLNIVMGDARLTLAHSPDKYGLIVLDAFSSDAIPIHLLTLEAIRTYLDHLEPDGVLAFHISNRYLDLTPVLARAGRDLGLKGKYQEDGATVEEKRIGKTESHWLILGRPGSMDRFRRSIYWSEMDPADDKRAWTDDYSNVLGAFKTDE